MAIYAKVSGKDGKSFIVQKADDRQTVIEIERIIRGCSSALKEIRVLGTAVIGDVPRIMAYLKDVHEDIAVGKAITQVKGEIDIYAEAKYPRRVQ